MKCSMFVKKTSAALIALLLSAGAVTSSAPANMIKADYEDQISELEQRQSRLAEEKAAIEQSLAELKDSIEEEEEYLALYDEKMALQEQEMENITSQLLLINENLAELDNKIAEKTAEIDEGIVEFRERLRAMYMAGNDSIAEVLAGSSNFYDMLARMEMVQRVSKHDNEMITKLTEKVKALNSDKDALEEEREMLSQKKEEQLKLLDELRETYANHSETKQWYEAQAAAAAERTEELELEEERTEIELQDFIRQQQAEIEKKMAAKRKAREEKRKAAEKTTVTTTEAVTETTTETTTEVTTTEEAPEETSAETTSEAYTEAESIMMYASPEPYAKDEYTVTTLAEEEDYDVVLPEDYGADAEFVDPFNYYNFDRDDTEAEAEPEDDYDDGDKGYGTYPHTGFIWPVPTVRNITDGYGNRYIEEEGSSSFHKGIDINKPGCKGEAIVASAGGVVITASNTGNGYGIHVVIDHGDGIATLYGHMDSTTVSVGDEVQQGQVIGYIGCTGYAYGNHCHFEVRVNGNHTDPFDYVSMDN